jgi:hypothetical protein
MDVVITVEKVRALNMQWAKNGWLNHALKRCVACNVRCTHCDNYALTGVSTREPSDSVAEPEPQGASFVFGRAGAA